MILSNNFIVLIVLLTNSCDIVFGRPNLNSKIVQNAKCGYESCSKPKPNMINVHIVPHTHDDVGWLKTVDQYYYGSKTNIQKAGVQYIIDSVIKELLNDPKKKFIYVESAFFFKWWKEQTHELQDKVKMLVNEGRLEFIGGAWSMNDEATTHYQSVIDQFAWGLRLLNDTFGQCGRPRIGWQIDPFGHSREMASMFAQMGYDGLFFGRLDEQDKLRRLTTKTAEMIWKASPNLGESSDLFTGALFNQYQPPPGFCFDILCADEPIIDGKHSPDNNVDRRVNEYFDFINKQSKDYKTNNVILTMGGDFTYMNAYVYYNNLDKLIREFFNYIEVMSDGYRSNNVLITMGEDFHYQAAHMWYKNLDKLIKYGNEKQQTNNSNINLFYSTPSCYLKALYDAGITWPTKTDDFFPYGSDSHSYWTGYFTSRPTLKRYERIGNHFLQVCKQLTALSATNNHREFQAHLNFMRETMGIMQHHDAVTGTEKQKVADDYAKRIDVGMRACNSNTRSILNKMVTGDDLSQASLSKNIRDDNNYNHHTTKRNYKFRFDNCLLLNISQCDISEQSENFIITLYNPLARSTFQYIRVPVPSNFYEVKDYRGVPTQSQIVPIPESIQSLNFRKSSSQFELVFLASELPPMGYKSYYITKTIKDTPAPKPIPGAEDITIGNKQIQLKFKNGLLSFVSANGVNSSITQEFAYYEGAVGNNREAKNRSSGAYIFRPNGTEAHLITDRVETTVVQGSLVQEVHQKFNNWISQVIRVYKDENHAEFEWLVGPISVDDNIGKEIITRFTSDIKSNQIFYTDSNGREMIKRKRDHRDTWELNVTEKISGNYYPLTTKIALEDEKTRMAILVDRAQGGSSITDGSIEIMVHRRLLKDDAFGVDEALNETAYGSGLVARGHHYLILGPTKGDSPTTQAKERFLQIEKLLPAWIFLSDSKDYTYDQWRTQFTHISSGLTLALPKHLHLMTFEPWHDNQILIRFEHLLEKYEDPTFSQSVTFNLKDIFYYLKIESIRETTLDGNQWLDETKRLKFNADTVNRVENENFKFEEKIDVILKSRHQRKIEMHAYEENLSKEEEDVFKITIKPMQIRTFIINLEEQV